MIPDPPTAAWWNPRGSHGRHLARVGLRPVSAYELEGHGRWPAATAMCRAARVVRRRAVDCLTEHVRLCPVCITKGIDRCAQGSAWKKILEQR